MSQWNVSCVVGKPDFWVADQVWHKPECTTTEDGLRLEIFWFRQQWDCIIYVVKAKVLISCMVTAQLICAYVFAYAKSGFSHDMSQIYMYIHRKGKNGKTATRDSHYWDCLVDYDEQTVDPDQTTPLLGHGLLCLPFIMIEASPD